MDNMDNAVNQLIKAILESDTYREYALRLEQIKQQPGLKEKADDFRTRSYLLQMDGDAALDKFDQYEREFEEFIENPYVADFFTAELALCKMIQDIDTRITEALQFE